MAQKKTWWELEPEEKDAAMSALLEVLGLEVLVVDERRYKSVQLVDADGEIKGSAPVG